VSARAQVVLDRFPLHLAATDPEKGFELVVTSLVGSLEVLTRQVSDVRRSHRLGEAPTVSDLLALANLHGLPESALDLLLLRLAAIPADAPEAALTRHRPSLRLRRDVIRSAIRAHRVGNGTATALLTATAAYLGFGVGRVTHDEHRWWHLAECLDALDTTTPQTDLVALEENPFRRADLEPTWACCWSRPRRTSERSGSANGTMGMRPEERMATRRAAVLLVPGVLGLLSGAPGAVLAAEPAARFHLIVHPDAAVAVLDRQLVADIFLKKTTRWPDDSPIAAVDLRFGSPVREEFSERVLRRSVSAVRSYWQQRIFTGRGVPPPELDSDEAVIRYVQGRRGAIGYVSEKVETGAVKRVVLR